MSFPEIHLHFHDGADEARVTALEEQVGQIEDDLVALNARVTEYNEDVVARVTALEAAIAANDPVAVQAAVDALKATVEAGVSFVGDADADGNPAVVPTP